MTTAALRAAGEALYGDRWQVPLARALGVNDRTMRRWAAGSPYPADRVDLELRRLLTERRSVIDDLLRIRGANR